MMDGVDLSGTGVMFCISFAFCNCLVIGELWDGVLQLCKKTTNQAANITGK